MPISIRNYPDTTAYTYDYKQECQHKNTETVWTYIQGEAVKQPDHDVCLDCGERVE